MRGCCIWWSWMHRNPLEDLALVVKSVSGQVNQIIAFKLRLYYFYYVLLSRPHYVIPIKLKWNKNDTRRVMTMLLRTTSTETLNKSPCFRDKSMRSHSAKRKNRYKCSSIPTCVRMFEWQNWSDIVRVSGSKKQKKEKKKETEGAAA